MKKQQLAVVMLSALALAGCGKEATGQVAAVVNGDEITLQEINAEMGNTPVPEGVDKKLVQQAALQRILERRLLAQAAKSDGLDSSPDYLLRERQLRDALLVQLLGQKTERSLKVPSEQEIDKFIADNPILFGGRKIFTLDRIQFALPKDLGSIKALENDHSMAAVATRLDQLGIKYRRDAAQMDSAQIGAERLKQIQALPAGEPFVVPENGVVTVGIITGERSEPVAATDARPMAVQAIRSKQLTESLQQRLKQARSEADIKYQSGFTPPAPDKQGVAKK